jgi:hypothetical protein
MWQPHQAPSFLASIPAHADPLQEDSWLHPSLLSVSGKSRQSVQWSKLLRKKAVVFSSCGIYGIGDSHKQHSSSTNEVNIQHSKLLRKDIVLTEER